MSEERKIPQLSREKINYVHYVPPTFLQNLKDYFGGAFGMVCNWTVEESPKPFGKSEESEKVCVNYAGFITTTGRITDVRWKKIEPCRLTENKGLDENQTWRGKMIFTHSGTFFHGFTDDGWYFPDPYRRFK